MKKLLNQVNIGQYNQLDISKELENQSITLRKRNMNNNISKRRQKFNQNTINEFNKNKFNHTIKLMASPISNESIFDTLSQLSYIFTSECYIDPIDFLNSKFVQVINHLILTKQSDEKIIVSKLN